MGRQLTIEIDDILDLIICAEDYGYENSYLLATLSEMIGALTNEDIEAHVERYKRDPYEEEDQITAREKLQDFRRTYLKEQTNER